MKAADNLCAAVLRRPRMLEDLGLAQWDVLIRQARHADLLARVAVLARAHGLWGGLPDAPRCHLLAAEAVARRQDQAMRYELDCLARALAALPPPVVLLKGAAYLAAGLPSSAGRLFGDIDVLVPKVRLDDAESALLIAGWHSSHHNAYDQRYYRKWMHELPPLQHVKRHSIVDLHHAILPETSRLASNPAPLFEAAVAIPGYPVFATLSPADMVLHSATHLFSDGEFRHGLRDLADLDALLRHFGVESGFWAGLETRARLFHLERPLHYALRYAAAVLATPVPDDLRRLGRPAHERFMDALFGRALAPEHSSCDDLFSQLARRILYVRGHWLRMPLHLLIPHLAHKALVQDEAA